MFVLNVTLSSLNLIHSSISTFNTNEDHLYNANEEFGYYHFTLPTEWNMLHLDIRLSCSLWFCI